jgi:hypothetical protein
MTRQRAGLRVLVAGNNNGGSIAEILRARRSILAARIDSPRRRRRERRYIPMKPDAHLQGIRTAFLMNPNTSVSTQAS